ncbi:MAG TPA: efflux RND transporter periplasmic adaptor subunit [Bryobacteraceae bacterium]|nr:efflux RND transporter periplasmic adaptor subunit [Bryobacteraceae bacterium]
MPLTEPLAPPVRTPAVDQRTPLETQPETTPPHQSRRKAILVLAAVCFAAVLVATGVWRYEQAKSIPSFQLARVETGEIESTVSATGTCNAVVNVQVGSQVSGNIKALYADFNSTVKAGELVAMIDPQMFQAKVDQAEAAWQNSKASLENARANAAKAAADLSGAKASEANQLAAIAKAQAAVADAKAKLARRVEMFKDQILAQEDLDTAQATYDQAVAELDAAQAQHDAAINSVRSAEAALQASQMQVRMLRAQVELTFATLKQARIDLANTRILSPVDGTVVARQMDVGQTVAASFQAPTIFLIAQDLKKMQVDTNIDESDVGRLRMGQQAAFTVDAYPGVVFRGPIVQIRKAPINVQNVITYDAVVKADNPELKLFPGMTANVSVVTERRASALKVPNTALRFRPADSMIAGGSPPAKSAGENWRIVFIPGGDSMAHPVRVRVGISDGTYTEVEQGKLASGQQVIVGVKSQAPTTASAAPSMMRRF